VWVHDPANLAICAGVGAAVWVIGFRDRAERLLLWPDAIGLAAFAVLGARKALALGVDPIVSVLMGVLTAIAGGIIRDITAGEPSVLLQRQIYVSAALLAAAAYVVLAAPLGADVASLVAFAAGAALRLAAMIFGWSLPSYSGGLLGRGAVRSPTAADA
jgi:uncharacterized membrane protein YeiH